MQLITDRQTKYTIAEIYYIEFQVLTDTDVLRAHLLGLCKSPCVLQAKMCSSVITFLNSVTVGTFIIIIVVVYVINIISIITEARGFLVVQLQAPVLSPVGPIPSIPDCWTGNRPGH